MRLTLAILFNLILVVLAAGGAHAESAPIYPSGQPTGMAIRHMSQTDANGNYQLYGGSGGPPDNWVFGQPQNWSDNTPGAPPEFPPLAQDGNGNWSAGNGLALAQWLPNGVQPAWQLAQNGQYVPCTDSDNNILEYDLGVSANTVADPNNSAQYPAAEIPYQNQPYLTQLASYSMSGTYQLISARYANQNNGCQLNNSIASIGLLVINTVANPHQILFYSIEFSRVCYDDGVEGSYYASCQQNVTSPTPYWYWLGAQGTGTQYQVSSDGTQGYGLSDTLQGYGYGQVTDNAPHQMYLDIRNRINLIVSGGYKGMDPDLSHWKIANPGFNQVTWGNTYLQSIWTGFVPVMTTQ